MLFHLALYSLRLRPLYQGNFPNFLTTALSPPRAGPTNKKGRNGQKNTCIFQQTMVFSVKAKALIPRGIRKIKTGKIYESQRILRVRRLKK